MTRSPPKTANNKKLTPPGSGFDRAGFECQATRLDASSFLAPKPQRAFLDGRDRDGEVLLGVALEGSKISHFLGPRQLSAS